MESSRIYYYFLKLAGVFLGTMCVYAALCFAFFPEQIRNIEQLSPEGRIAYAVVFVMISGGLLFVGWRAAYVRFAAQHLELCWNGRRSEIPWSEVQGITKIPCTTPPIYWIRFYERPGVAVIPWSWIVLSVGFWSWDFSKFRDTFEARIAETTRALNQG